MRSEKFGSGQPDVSVIGQGSWYIDRGDRKRAVAALRRGIDLGMTHIDTAEMYGDAELVIAEAIAGRRDELFLVSKVLPSNASRRGTIAACERSLARLKTDRLDCYLLHWRGSYPLSEKERAIEHAVIPWCEQLGVAVVAYSPFGHDNFPSARSKAGQVLGTIAEAHGASPRQIALAFLTRKPAVFAIPKASSEEHAADNAAAGKLSLSDSEVAALDKAFPRGSKPRGLPML